MLFFVHALKKLKSKLKNYLIYPKIFGLMLSVLLISGYLVYYFEKGKSVYFHSWWDGIWFSVITSATVGYGDKFPVTVAGKLVTMVLILIGGSLLAVLIANIGGSFAMRVSRKERGLLPVRHLKGHTILCNWNKQVKAAIQDYRKAHHDMSFVLIDDEMESNPAEEFDVYYVRGDFTDDDILTKANVQQASILLIFGDRRIDENTADAKAMKAVLAIKYLNPKVHTTVECLSGDVRSLKRVGADEVINTGEINSRLLVQTTLLQGVSSVWQELLAKEYGNEFLETTVTDKYDGKSIAEVGVELRRMGVILIALITGEVHVNPDPKATVKTGNRLIYIGKKEIPTL